MSEIIISPGREPFEMRVVLHVGCGPRSTGKLHDSFHPSVWREVRLDVDPGVKPDIVASMTSMTMVESSSIDAIWSSHNLEHLFAHEVPLALSEFYRVLRPSGFARIVVPNLQVIARLVAEDKLEDVAYRSPSGPITPLDMLYGHRASIARGNVFMAHRTGFTPRTLTTALTAAGFARVSVSEKGFAIYAHADKNATA